MNDHGRDRSSKTGSPKGAGAKPVPAPAPPLAKSAADRYRDAAMLETRRVIHELQLHQLELELQNRELRDAQGTLEESRARYAELYDYAPIGHMTVDRNGVIREMNLTCATLLGKERRFLFERPVRTLFTPPSRRAFDAMLRDCLATGKPGSAELWVVSSGREPRVVEVVSVPYPNGGAGVTVCHCAVTDISARKREDEQRAAQLAREREARQAAETANRVREDFLAMVSHELRTPLAPMMLWVKALRTGGAGENLRARAIDAIELCLRAQVAMIDDLVDVARGTHGKLRIDRRPLDLQPLVSRAIDALAPSAAAKQIEVTLTLGSDRAWVSGDPTRLQQVVSNLLSNAVKFTREAGHVAVTLSVQGAEVVLSVRDDGEGLDPDFLSRVFEPFRQRDNTQVRRHGGLGLGLTIVRQLVIQHGGHVRADSAGKGQGACFTVTLPRLREGAGTLEDPSTPAPVRDPGPASDPTGTLAGLRILVVEDQVDTREALALTLETYGAEVTTAASATEGRHALDRLQLDVLVSDIGMSDEDGYTFMSKVRSMQIKSRAGGPLPAVALTAHASKQDRARALGAGFDRHLSKPIEFEQLVSTIAALVGREPKDDAQPTEPSDAEQPN